MSKKVAGYLLILITLLFSCVAENTVYDKAYAFKNNTWSQDVKPVFSIDIPDTSHFYTMRITIRTTTDYGYNNLWFFIRSKAPSGETGREPYEMKIVNPDGSWIGKTSGTIVENTVYFKHRKFPQKGKYTYIFEQGITQETANNVMDISCSVTRDE